MDFIYDAIKIALFAMVMRIVGIRAVDMQAAQYDYAIRQPALIYLEKFIVTDKNIKKFPLCNLDMLLTIT